MRAQDKEMQARMSLTKRGMFFVWMLMASAAAFAEARTVPMLPEEKWWGVESFRGSEMPFDAKTVLEVDLRRNGNANQYASLLLSDRGRVIWCDEQTDVVISNGVISMASAAAPVRVTETEADLRTAFRIASKTYFPPSGKTPDLMFFSAPQYNTWIELTYRQNEKDVLAYARSMLDNGLPPGVLMIDDTWQAGYGDWRFEPGRFPNPKGLCDKLHAMGFKVVLWVCPWVGMDTPAFRRIALGVNPDDVRGYPTRGGFLTAADGRRYRGTDFPDPVAVTWWNGKSALLDFTHPNAVAWFREQLDGLVRNFGIDGFKFDGGELEFYSAGLRTHHPASSGDQVLAYARFALDYPCCEYRNAWRFQGQPVVERLHDKPHTWEALRKLVPDLIAGGLLGHPFMCPDMIGGGAWTAFLPGSPFDAELFVRSAQVHALCGMMQFSASPWRVLDAEKQRIIRDLVKLRQEKFAVYFVDLAKECGRTGEPMIRNLEYEFPHQGYAEVKDQFLMGDFLMVTPQLRKEASSREVAIPPGRWRADDGTVVTGPRHITVETPLSRLPYFELER